MAASRLGAGFETRLGLLGAERVDDDPRELRADEPLEPRDDDPRELRADEPLEPRDDDPRELRAEEPRELREDEPELRADEREGAGRDSTRGSELSAAAALVAIAGVSSRGRANASIEAMRRGTGLGALMIGILRDGMVMEFGWS